MHILLDIMTNDFDHKWREIVRKIGKLVLNTTKSNNVFSVEMCCESDWENSTTIVLTPNLCTESAILYIKVSIKCKTKNNLYTKLQAHTTRQHCFA